MALPKADLLAIVKPAQRQKVSFNSVGMGRAVMTIVFCLLMGKCLSSLQAGIRMATKTGSSLNFLVVGDWGRKGYYNQSEVATQMGRIGEELNIDFIISTGDNFYKSGLTGIDDPSFEESFSRIYTAQSLQTTWYSVLGNHDYRGDALAQLSPSLRNRDQRWHCERSFVLKYDICPWFADCNSIEFFFVDTTPFVDYYWEPSEHNYDWRGVIPRENYLKQQLKDLTVALEASTATWKIAVGHHAIRSVGSHGDTVELVRHLLPILEGYGVDLYMNGHDHCLEHISSINSPIQFLTSGGGSKAWRGMKNGAETAGFRFFHDGQGFISVQVTATMLQVAFHDIEGKTIHGLHVLKEPYPLLSSS